MKKMMFLALFLIFPMVISAVCSAAENDKKEVLLVNQTPFEFISSCNETLKDSNGGQAVFPKPEMLPQASTENEKMFAVFVPLDEKNHGMILMRTNTMDKVLAMNITVPNKDEFPRIASNISAAVLSTIGLNDEEMKNIFFFSHGELELSVKMSFEELNDIIKGLGGKVNEEKEKKLACDSIEFHKFYYMKKHTFRFCLLKDNEIAGLEDFVIDGKYFCDCTVASGKISIFELEENFYQNLVAEKQIKKNVDEYVTLKKTVLCQRLLSVRETKLVNEKSKINI